MYVCSCYWYGSELRYDEGGVFRRLLRRLFKARLWESRWTRVRGRCPKCGRAFVGCFS